MKICFISDTHRLEKQVEVPECDVLVHSGDIDAYTIGDLIHFRKWMNAQPAKYKIFVPGNHDRFFEHMFPLACEEMKPTIVLHNSGITIDGVKFWGSAFTPEFNDWAFNAKRGPEIKRYWDMIPDDTDVLITHGPAHLILDFVKRDRFSAGCADLLERIKQIKPKIHACGHIHTGYGTEVKHWVTEKRNCDGEWDSPEQKQTLFINAALVNDVYKIKDRRVVNKPIVTEV